MYAQAADRVHRLTRASRTSTSSKTPTLRQHKRQKLKMVFIPKAWRVPNTGLWITPTEGINTLVALSTIFSALVAVVVIFK